MSGLSSFCSASDACNSILHGMRPSLRQRSPRTPRLSIGAIVAKFGSVETNAIAAEPKNQTIRPIVTDEKIKVAELITLHLLILIPGTPRILLLSALLRSSGHLSELGVKSKKAAE